MRKFGVTVAQSHEQHQQLSVRSRDTVRHCNIILFYDVAEIATTDILQHKMTFY